MEKNELLRDQRILDFCAYYLTRTSQLPVLGRKFLKESQKKNGLNFPDFIENMFKDIMLDPRLGISELSQLIEGEKKDIFKDRLVFLVKEHVPKIQEFLIFSGGVDRAYQEYLLFSNLSPGVYISYYFMRIRLARNSAGYNISKFKTNCESFFAKMIFLEKNLRSKIEDQRKLSLEADLAHTLDISDFQLMGFFDEKGLYVDEKKTLKKTIEFISKFNSKGLKYTMPISDDLNSIQLLKLKIFGYYQQNNPTAKKAYLSAEQLILFQDLEKLKRNEWKNIIEYLLSKNFTDLEIDFLINTLYGGKFDDLELRSIKLHNDIQVFHLWYLFYLFDYQKELAGNALKRIKDFQIVIDLQSILDRNNKEKPKQVYRYYKGRQFGFSTIAAIISEIEEEFHIKRGRLKAVPDQVGF